MRVLLLACVAVGLWAQNSAVLITLRHMNLSLAGQIAEAYGDGKVKVSGNSSTVILSGPPELLAIIQKAIEKADLPDPVAKNVELTFYVLTGADAASRDPLPDELAGVAKQVKGILGVPALRMVESIQIRTRVGRSSEASGILGRSAGGPNLYQLRIQAVEIHGEANARALRLTGLKFGARIASGANYVDTGFNTDVDFKEGQKIVIGKSSLDTSGTPYFVVVTGKVVD
jgi:hypothetical protein